MPILDVFGRGALLDIARNDCAFLKELTGKELADDEWAVDENHISLRYFEFDGSPLGDIELVISAHSFRGRSNRKDQICAGIRKCLERRWRADVCVWLQLVDMGYGFKKDE